MQIESLIRLGELIVERYELCQPTDLNDLVAPLESFLKTQKIDFELYPFDCMSKEKQTYLAELSTQEAAEYLCRYALTDLSRQLEGLLEWRSQSIHNDVIRVYQQTTQRSFVGDRVQTLNNLYESLFRVPMPEAQTEKYIKTLKDPESISLNIKRNIHALARCLAKMEPYLPESCGYMSMEDVVPDIDAAFRENPPAKLQGRNYYAGEINIDGSSINFDYLSGQLYEDEPKRPLKLITSEGLEAFVEAFSLIRHGCRAGIFELNPIQETYIHRLEHTRFFALRIGYLLTHLEDRERPGYEAHHALSVRKTYEPGFRDYARRVYVEDALLLDALSDCYPGLSEEEVILLDVSAPYQIKQAFDAVADLFAKAPACEHKSGTTRPGELDRTQVAQSLRLQDGRLGVQEMPPVVAAKTPV